MHDLRWYNLPYMFFWTVAAKIMRKKVYYVSMGIGPIDTRLGKWLCKRCLPMADKIYPRDRRGVEICNDLGIKNVVPSCDFALLNKDEDVGKSNQLSYGLIEEEYITFSACAWFRSDNYWDRESMDFSHKKEELLYFINQLYEFFGKKIVFVPTFRYDEELGKELEKKMKNETLICLSQDWSYADFEEIIAKAWMHVGMRMHSLIFSLRANKPIIALVYDEKVNQLLDKYCLNNVRLSLDELDQKVIFDVFRYINTNRRVIIESILQKNVEIKEIGLECLEELKNI